MRRADVKARTTRDEEILAAVAAAKESGDITLCRAALLELLAHIHEKMDGVTEEEVVAILEADAEHRRSK
jgi:hypothetical protein